MMLRTQDLIDRIQRSGKDHFQITIKDGSFECELPVEAVIIKDEAHFVLKVNVRELIDAVTDHPAYQEECTRKYQAGISKQRVLGTHNEHVGFIHADGSLSKEVPPEQLPG